MLSTNKVFPSPEDHKKLVVKYEGDPADPSAPDRRIRSKTALRTMVATSDFPDPSHKIDMVAADALKAKDFSPKAVARLALELSKVPCKVLGSTPAPVTVGEKGAFLFAGAFSYGGITGLQNSAIDHPWLTAYLAKYLQQFTSEPFAAVGLIWNAEHEPHRDCHNQKGIKNIVVPVVTSGGGVWVQSEGLSNEQLEAEEVKREVKPGVQIGGRILTYHAGSPITFNAAKWHASVKGSGQQLLVVGYTPRSLHKLKPPERKRLWDLGFPFVPATHDEFWTVDSKRSMITRHHPIPRKPLFVPKAGDVPFPLEFLGNVRYCEQVFADGNTSRHMQQWRQTRASLAIRAKWTGKSVFQFAGPGQDCEDLGGGPPAEFLSMQTELRRLCRVCEDELPHGYGFGRCSGCGILQGLSGDSSGDGEPYINDFPKIRSLIGPMQQVASAAGAQEGPMQQVASAAGAQEGPMQQVASAAGAQEGPMQQVASAAGAQEGPMQQVASAAGAQEGPMQQVASAAGAQEGPMQQVASTAGAQEGLRRDVDASERDAFLARDEGLSRDLPCQAVPTEQGPIDRLRDWLEDDACSESWVKCRYLVPEVVSDLKQALGSTTSGVTFSLESTPWKIQVDVEREAMLCAREHRDLCHRLEEAEEASPMMATSQEESSRDLVRLCNLEAQAAGLAKLAWNLVVSTGSPVIASLDKLLDPRDDNRVCALRILAGQDPGDQEIELRPAPTEEFLQTRLVSAEEVRKDMQTWKPSMVEEYTSLVHTTGTCDPLSNEQFLALMGDPNVKIEVLPGKMVFSIKAKSGRKKTRIVGCGNFQQGSPRGKLDTHASGISAEAIRLIVRLAGHAQWTLSTTDIKTAFLNAPIVTPNEELIVVRVPGILRAANVCQEPYWLIRRALYGLDVAPRSWTLFRNQTLGSISELLDGTPVSCKHSAADSNLWELWVEKSSKLIAWIGVYVDDLLVASPEECQPVVMETLRSLWTTSEPEIVTEDKDVTFAGYELREKIR